MGGGVMDYYPVADYRPATVQCILESAVRRDVPANVLLAIAEIEGGKEGEIKRNTNGSFDFGRWQINSVHLQELSRYGVAPEVAKYYLVRDGCYGAEMAAYRLKRCLVEGKDKDFWERAACYHSKTPKNNAIYRAKLKPVASRWAQWLSTHYEVRMVNP